MPLIHKKSPAAFSKNVATEMNAKKPQAQSVAIAYSEQDRAHKDEGGPVEGSLSKPFESETIHGQTDAAPEDNTENELQDMIGDELMTAIHSKDRKKIVESLQALMLSNMSHKDEE